MPLTKYITLAINGAVADLGNIDEQDFALNFSQNDPDDWQSVQSDGASFTLPATKNNDRIFNTFWNSDIMDLSAGQSFRNLMDVVLSVNGSIPLLKGKLQLNSATYTDKPEQYSVSMAGGNGDWITDMQNLTLWDCLNTTTHNFTVANVEQSWLNVTGGGYDSDEFHDYVYAPVRYRAPWQYQDPNTLAQVINAAEIYMLRPLPQHLLDDHPRLPRIWLCGQLAVSQHGLFPPPRHAMDMGRLLRYQKPAHRWHHLQGRRRHHRHGHL